VGRVSERNREHIDRVLTVSALHGLVKQESFFTKRVAAKNLSSYLVVRQGTFVYNKSYSAAAPFGVATYNKTVEPGVISPLYFTFRPNPELVLDEYLEYVLNSNTFHQQMARYIKEGGRAHGGINVSVDDYLSVQVLLPTLQEQRRVVDLTSAVDSYIAALQQQADAARSARSAVLSELLSAGGADWTETTIGDVAELLPGKYVAKSEYVEDGPFFIYGSNSIMGKYSKSLIDVPHTVMAAIGAYAGAVRFSTEPSWVNNNAFGLVTNSRIEPKFLFLWLENVLDLKSVVVGTGQPYVQRPSLKASKIALPPINEQRRIVEIVSSMDDVIQSADKAVTDAKSLRSGLLSDLLSGAHEIPESYDRLLGAA